MRCGAPACGGVPPRVPAAGVSLVPRPSYPFASPSPSLPVPNFACPPLASKFIPPPPPEAGRRVLNVLRRLKEYDFVRESASQSIDCAQMPPICE